METKTMTKQEILNLKYTAQRLIRSHTDIGRMFPTLSLEGKDDLFADMLKVAKGFDELVPNPFDHPDLSETLSILEANHPKCFSGWVDKMSGKLVTVYVPAVLESNLSPMVSYFHTLGGWNDDGMGEQSGHPHYLWLCPLEGFLDNRFEKRHEGVKR